MTICGECGWENPDVHRFCGSCGSPLHRHEITGRRDRKVVSVLFCDMVGFTAAADGADPEDVHAWLSAYHDTCREAVERFGGTVEKFIGDAVMAAFGAPVVHEDDAERAVRAGLAVLAAVDALDQERGWDLAVRVGIATGEALVLTDARPERGETLVAGDLVNTAARLQSVAPVGGVLVDRPTHARTGAVIELAEHDPVVVKGKRDPLEVWVATGTRGWTGEQLADNSTPMVGRAEELAALQEAFRRAAEERTVALVTLVGEAGVGKSRLVQALADWLGDRDNLVTWRQGRCPPYGDVTSYSALGDLLKAQCGILDSDPSDVAVARLDETVAALAAGTRHADQVPWLVSRLSPLLGLGSIESPQDELFTAWRRFLELLASTGPLVVVVEDLHWAAAPLLDFLTSLVESAQGVPLLVVATARPELHDAAPAWGGSAGAVTVRLSRLDPEETRELVAAWLGDRELPADLQDTLLERADGHPLYAREFLALLTAPTSGSSMPEELPDSLTAVIAARLDALVPAQKSLLQAASVLGRTVWSGAVAALRGLEENVARIRLDDLVAHEHLTASSASRIAGDAEYLFSHDLVADVAYRQLPRAERCTLHEQVAGWYVARIGDPRRNTDAAVVAHHFGRAHDLATALEVDPATVARLAAEGARWHGYAAEQAWATDASAALRFAQTAVDLTTDDDEAGAERLVLLAQSLVETGQLSAAEEVAGRALAYAEALGDVATSARAMTQLTRTLGSLGRMEESSRMCARMVALLEQGPPSAELVRAYSDLSWDQSQSGQSEAAVVTLERAFAVLDELADAPSQLRVSLLRTRGQARIWAGDVDGVDDLRQALELAERDGLTDQLIWINNNLALWNYVTRNAPDAEPYCRAAVRQAVATGRLAENLLVSGNLAEVLVILGRVEDAVAVCRDAAELGRHLDSPRDWAATHLLWAWALMVTGAWEEARETLAAGRVDQPGHSQDLRAQYLLNVVEADLGEGRDSPLLAELVAMVADPRTHEVLSQYVGRVARLLRTVDRLDLLPPLMAEAETGLTLFEHNLATARATVAEAGGEHRAALDLHRDAAVAWGEYGYPLEEALAHLGAARCSRALAEPAAHHLEQARRIGTAIGARPVLAEIDGLTGTA